MFFVTVDRSPLIGKCSASLLCVMYAILSTKFHGKKEKKKLFHGDSR